MGQLAFISGVNDWPGSPECFERISSKPNQTDWFWTQGNETFLRIAPESGLRHCAADRALKTMSSKSLLHGKYVMVGGIAIHNTALGLPFFQYTTGVVAALFGEIFGSQGNLEHLNVGFHWMRQCLPVLRHNPVQCQRPVTYEVNDGNSNVAFYTDSKDCALKLPIASMSNGMIKDQRAGKACPSSQVPGKTTLLFGALGNNSALDLYDFMHGDINSDYNSKKPLNWGWDATDDATVEQKTAIEHRKNVVKTFWSEYPNGYGITCDIDIEPSIGWRMLTLSSVDATVDGMEHSARLAVFGNEDCEPILQNGSRLQALQTFLRSDENLAAGASATASLLSGVESNLTPLMESMLPGWGSQNDSFFGNSKNTFEDTLGVASAIAVGMHWGSTPSEEQFNITNGILAMARTRVGSKDAKAILCILPLVFTALILTFLAIDEHRLSNTATDTTSGE